MRLSVRRRVIGAVLLALPIGYVSLMLGAHLVFDLLQFWRGGATTCDSGTMHLVDAFNGCYSSFNPLWALFELVVVVVGVAAACWGLGRWVSWPLRAMRATVEQLGPTSLGMRIRATGQPDESTALADAIDRMLDRLAEGYEAQRRFAANASHELRTPLATQRALIEISLQRALSPDQLELLTAQLLATNERNEKLVDGLLALAETEEGLLTRAPQRLDLIALAVADSLRALAKEREIEVDVDAAPVTISGEAPLLDRLCTNLVQNAIKYNRPGGWVRVGVRGDGTLTVENTGPVVPAELVPALFEPFRRAGGERLDHHGGVGLGLTIARSIVAAHGGSISAAARPDGGLTVSVRLPATRAE